MKKLKLKVGILLNSFDLPLWEYELLQELIDSDYASIELIILNNNPSIKKSLFQKVKSKWNMLAYLLYLKLDEKVFSVAKDAFKIKNSEGLLKEISLLKVQTISTKFSDRFKSEDIEQVKEKELDIVLRFGFNILRGEILNSSKYGIWSYHHGDNKINRGGSAGFWEVIENNGNGVTGSVVQILTEDLDAGKVLARSYSKTDEFSIRRNRNNHFWKSSALLPRKIKELHTLGEKEFFKKVNEENIYPSFYSNRLYSKTNFSNFKMSRIFMKQVFNILKTKISQKFFLEQWILLFNFQDTPSSSFWKFKKIIPPKDRFYADPFVVYKNEKYYIFLEELPYSTNKGHISVIEMNKKGEYGKATKIIDAPYHLSYPHIIEENNEYYMIPENVTNSTVDLYKCIEFPYKWDFQMSLMEDIEAVDSTIFYYNNKYWLFCNIMEKEGSSNYDELYLFHADKLMTKEWVPHPLNPVVSDVRKARPAGNIFIMNEKIIRPAQNCSKYYGYGMSMNEILVLNEHDYKERLIEDIEPNWEKNITRTHTFNHVEGLTLIDAKYLRRKI